METTGERRKAKVAVRGPARYVGPAPSGKSTCTSLDDGPSCRPTRPRWPRGLLPRRRLCRQDPGRSVVPAPIRHRHRGPPGGDHDAAAPDRRGASWSSRARSRWDTASRDYADFVEGVRGWSPTGEQLPGRRGSRDRAGGSDAPASALQRLRYVVDVHRMEQRTSPPPTPPRLALRATSASSAIPCSAISMAWSARR